MRSDVFIAESLFISALLNVFTLVRRHVTGATVRAIIVALRRPHVGPLVARIPRSGNSFGTACQPP